MCASETLLSPQDCKILGTNPSRIKEEILLFKRKNYQKKGDFKIQNSGKKDDKDNENSDNWNSQKLQSSHCDGEKTSDDVETLSYDQIANLEDVDIFCRVFKMGFGKGKENPVTNSTSFFRPDKITEKDFAGSSVTYTEGIVHPSTLIKNFILSALILHFAKHGSLISSVYSTIFFFFVFFMD